ncbi:hypothetical protein F511_22219 [Dorcoceras hygrometricum]|uniref:Uncharacterized protein n=1 Tax=Dorcoceras hygrometricum TaxID=472368 RepID=A0A2Z7C969_9LAMI|nr:hypothetical protein F511_22219 [Dorcoceras hygrometricum]
MSTNAVIKCRSNHKRSAIYFTERPAGRSQGHEICSNEKKDWLEMTPEDEEESACWGTRETQSSKDDEDQLKSGCKREEKKRAFNGLKKQPARTRPAQ